MESRSGPIYEEKEPLDVIRHNGAVTTIRRVEPSLSMGSLKSSITQPPPSRSTGTATSGRCRSRSQTQSSLQTQNLSYQNLAAAAAAADPSSQPPQPQPQPPPSRRGRKGFTVHWPFQSIATDTLSIFTSAAPELFRRATWQPPQQLGGDDKDGGDSTFARDSTLIPDYVVNFIRGETPETVARRKRNGGNQGMRAVDITHVHRPQRSQTGLLEEAAAAGLRQQQQQQQHHHHHHPLRQEMTAARAGYARSHGSGTTDTTTTTELRQIWRSGGHRKRGWEGLTTGWRSGVLLNLFLIVVVLVTGFVCLVVAGTKMAILVGDMNLYVSTCSEAARVDWGLHALVNVAVVVLIVGANYVFQVLSSPKRSEISGAHESRKWLEIGVPSVRNLKHIGRGRAVLAVVVLAVAVVAQIIYNSLIFTTATGFDYDLVAVSTTFLTGGDFSNASSSNSGGLTRSALLDLQGLATSGALTRLATPACVDVFSGAFNADYQAILLVLSGAGDADNALVATARGGLNESPQSNLTSTSGSSILVDGSEVTYCLAQPADPARQTCTVNLNGILLAVVLGLNLAAFLLTASTLLLQRFEPLVTLGDAVSSFLRDPDPSTRSNCLLTRENLGTGLGGWGFREGKYWSPGGGRPLRYLRSASVAQWAAAGVWFLATAGAAAGVLALIVSGQPAGAPLGAFGRAAAHATYLVPASVPAAALAVAAQVPQVLLAGLYLSVNALLTAFFLSRESARYYAVLPGAGGGGPAAGGGPRALRVSNAAPAGHQTTSLYLTLPRPVSWALALWFAAMGFVLSQACFAVSLSSPAAAGEQQQFVRGFGFSGAALAVLLGMLGALGLAVGALAALAAPGAVAADGRAVGGNPLVFGGGSCSAVVSARCHRVPGEGDVWWEKVCFGAVPDLPGEDAGAPGHATFSTRARGLDTSRRYV